MDLGFGSANQQVGDLAAKTILRTAQAQENALEQELQSYDQLLNDNTALEQLRQRRLKQLQQERQAKLRYQQMGHGQYQELSDCVVSGETAQRHSHDLVKHFFALTKESPKVVVHFYRPSSPYCEVFHKHLARLATKHLETRFVKINVQDCESKSTTSNHGNVGISYLVEQFQIKIMPTLLLIQNRKVVHQMRGFDELNGLTEFQTSSLEYILGKIHNMVDYPMDASAPEELVASSSGGYRRNKGGVNSVNLNTGKRSKFYRDEEDSDDEDSAEEY